MARKKHKTAPHLDHLFGRNIITEDMYADFWPGYWDAENRRQYVKDFLAELKIEPKREITPPPRPQFGKLTKSLRKAKQDAKRIGGYVVRRRADGRFSKRGKTYQAIKKGKRK